MYAARGHTQQSRRRYAANGFALSPIHTVFLDGMVRAVKTGAVKQALRPLPFRGRGHPSSDPGTIAPTLSGSKRKLVRHVTEHRVARA